MKKIFYLILLVGLAGFRIDTSRTISGTVYDADNKKAMPGVTVMIEGTKTSTLTNKLGHYSIVLDQVNAQSSLVVSMIGYEAQSIKIKKSDLIDVWLKPSSVLLHEVVVVGYGSQKKENLTSSVSEASPQYTISGRVPGVSMQVGRGISPEANTESYAGISENQFSDPKGTPLSTFAIDVDAASYSNFRRFINNGQLPPKDAVRIEEMINYFHYNLPAPTNDDPVAIHTELSSAPWNPEHQLLRIGLKAKEVKTDKLPASNLVFLLDVSGSMNTANRLPLVKASMKMLVDQLRPVDRVAIVVYAGAAGLRLESTSCDQKTKIKDAIDDLTAGGSTAGGAGIRLAYKIARENYIKKGNNRIILATDGDFNVGVSSDKDMEQLITEERESGVSISILGFGMGNYKDSKLEILANKGHGNYAYIDNITEATKSMVTEFGGTLFTVAKDVKVQVEFNPSKVQAYRLLGYENRLLAKEDFNNDKKLGGDMGVGHTVTALYEIIPTGINSSFMVDPLKYQKGNTMPVVTKSTETVTIKFRYKQPDSDKSKMVQTALNDTPKPLSQTSDDFRFASAVAELGLLLRNSDFKQQSSYNNVIETARKAKGPDHEGYRAEFIRLAESARLMAKGSELALDTKK